MAATTSALRGLTVGDLGGPKAATIAGDVSYDELVVAVSEVIDLPVRSDGRASSFVLHAPLELLARVALREMTQEGLGDAALARLTSLAVRYTHAGPPAPPPGPADLDRAEEAVATLRAALAAGDAARADSAASWLAADVDRTQLRRTLADLVVLHVGAAGHVNIYTHLLGAFDRDGAAPMVRWLVRELCKEPTARIEPQDPAEVGVGPVEAFLAV